MKAHWAAPDWRWNAHSTLPMRGRQDFDEGSWLQAMHHQYAPFWCIISIMAQRKLVRRSVTLPQQLDKQVEAIAKNRRLSGNRVLVELLELGLEARDQKEKEFFELAQRFRNSNDPHEVKQLGDELGRFVFGE